LAWFITVLYIIITECILYIAANAAEEG